MASFDWQVEHYNSAGKVVRKNDYRMVVDEKGKRMERPPGSGVWYNEDGSILRDDSAMIQAQAQAKADAAALELAQADLALKAKERAALKEELLAELASEQKPVEAAKVVINGHSNKK